MAGLHGVHLCWMRLSSRRVTRAETRSRRLVRRRRRNTVRGRFRRPRIHWRYGGCRGKPWGEWRGRKVVETDKAAGSAPQRQVRERAALVRRGRLPWLNQFEVFVRLPQVAAESPVRFVVLEDLVRLCLDGVFPGFRETGKGAFRVIRDTDVEFEEEAEDLVRSYETALKRRRRAFRATPPTPPRRPAACFRAGG